MIERGESLALDVLAGAVKSAVDYAANRFVTKTVTQMLALLTPAGAVASLLKKLYDAVVWFLGNRVLLGELWDKLKSLFQAATGGLQASAIRDRVEEFLKAGLPTLLSGLAALVGLGDARKKVGQAVRKTSEAFWPPVESLLEKIAAPIKRQWQKLMEKLSGADPVAPPSREGDKTVWYDRTKKKVLVKQGLAPAQPVEQLKAAQGQKVKDAAGWLGS